MSIDDRARAAGRSLRDDVDRTTDTEDALAQVVHARAARRHRAWLPALAAAVVLVVAVAAVTATSTDHPPDDEVAIDVDRDADADVVVGAPLRMLAPDDGRDSIRLPVTVEPATGLVEGDRVRVTATGFVPGESVGVVQCSSDAGAPHFLGVDACRISPFTNLTADDSGTVTGDFQVVRHLTVPASGTVDCASGPGRCMIGVGAISNYDRSGGHPLDFAPADSTVELPSLQLATADGLADGQVVDVTGSGFSGEVVGLEVCSLSPAVCWQTGDPAGNDQLPQDSGFEVRYSPSLVVGDDGQVTGSVPLWRFLPGNESGTYVDCAVSACQLRVHSDLAPPPIALSFAGTEAPPVAAAIVVQPADGLAPGSVVEVTGVGFRPGAGYLSFCAEQPADQASPAPGVGARALSYCTSAAVDDQGDGASIPIGDDGGFEVAVELGDFRGITECQSETDCIDIVIDASWTFVLTVHAEAWNGGPEPFSFPPPSFGAAPVVLGFTP